MTPNDQKQAAPQRLRRRIRGMTLVELLVALLINTAVISAAAFLYLTTTRANTQTDEQGRQRETGILILDMIGRDLNNAGFYPFTYNPFASQTLTSATNVVTALERMTSGDFPNPAEGDATLAANASLASPVFGCSGARFMVSATDRTCPASVAGAPDSLVVNYYSADGFLGGSSDWSTAGPQARDCLGQRVAVGTESGATSTTREPLNNNRRPPSDATAPPTAPYFVQNSYALTNTQTVTLNGVSYQTRSFACAGNGNLASYQPLFDGVHDLRITYALMAAPPAVPPGGGTVPAPSRVVATPFQTAAAVTAAAAWGRVAAVRVCVITRTPLNRPRTTAASQYTDCDGTAVNVPATDTSLYATFERTFHLRNRSYIAFAY
jgi:type IV pilus assembly protein PilW